MVGRGLSPPGGATPSQVTTGQSDTLTRPTRPRSDNDHSSLPKPVPTITPTSASSAPAAPTAASRRRGAVAWRGAGSTIAGLPGTVGANGGGRTGNGRGHQRRRDLRGRQQGRQGRVGLPCGRKTLRRVPHHAAREPGVETAGELVGAAKPRVARAHGRGLERERVQLGHEHRLGTVRPGHREPVAAAGQEIEDDQAIGPHVRRAGGLHVGIGLLGRHPAKGAQRTGVFREPRARLSLKPGQAEVEDVTAYTSPIPPEAMCRSIRKPASSLPTSRCRAAMAATVPRSPCMGGRPAAHVA